MDKASAQNGRSRRRRGGAPGFAPAKPGRSGGTVLIVTIWIVLALAGMVVALARSMRVEALCSANNLSAAQAAAVEQGAIQYVLAHVDGLAGEVPTETDTPCQAVLVGNGAFWIVRPGDDDQTHAFGIVDEASKLNLNTSAAAVLEMLPSSTAEFAASIIDWRDSDSDLTTGGAESEYYLLQAEPYECKNAPFETIEELLLVKTATPEIVFGEDANRNGVLDANEDDGQATEPLDNGDGRLDRGCYDFVTVYSSEANISAAGETRLNVNNAQNQEISDAFTEAVPQDRMPIILDNIRRERPFQNLLDFYFRSALTIEQFRQVVDNVTVDTAEQSAGLVNVNTAPREVLACLPGLEEADVSALLAWREDPARDLTNIAWVGEALPRQKAIGIGRLITTRAYQFSADIVSVSGDGRAFRRCRIVVDASSSPPKVVYWQDLTDLGWPLEPDILSSLRSGVPVEDLVRQSEQGAW